MVNLALPSRIQVPGEGSVNMALGITLATNLGDRQILESVAVAGGRDGATLPEIISGMLAADILRMDIREGVELLFALTALIQRTMERIEAILGDNTGDDDGTLGRAFAHAKLLERGALGSGGVRETGLRVGDRACVMAGGLADRHLRRVMKTNEILDYCFTMARKGYATAILHSKGKDADVLRAQALGILQRFEEATAVLRFFFQARLANVDPKTLGQDGRPLSLEQRIVFLFEPGDGESSFS